MTNLSMGIRIKNLLVKTDMSQAELARRVGTKQQTISYIVRGSSSSQTSRYTNKIAGVLGVNPQWLQTGEGNIYDAIVPTIFPSRITGSTQVPILSPEEIPKYLLNEKFEVAGLLMIDTLVAEAVTTAEISFAFEVNDDSMSPQFVRGDVVVIDRAIEAVPGDYVIAMTAEQDILFRRFRTKRAGFELVPENKDWEVVDSQDNGAVVYGVMVEHRRYRRR
ncbi:COG2932 Predicted transcriptional regulator [uncultured Caudovirales phage]|uniref:COG2932 Predicted transcriptional regulator n=1 Tax=uncultured Caudovirales phage TaxID=2100421 RepID=A0A6J5RF19_9CAUD|nr:COG2932 Predicted transcriptional regulator [uncultured Caudovirales phage]